MKTNFVKLRWLFTMLLFVTTMIMPTMMLAKSIDLKIPEGDGAGTPYKIGTAEELYWFAGLVNGTLPGVKKDLSANAILTDDIIVNTGVLDPNKDLVSGNDFIEWIPIGKSSSDDDAYTGTFDGNGHTISGLYFNKSNSWYVGLFGCIGAEGKISNVGVSDSYFQSSNCPYIGGVCGSNSGELQNCSNSSTVIGKENEYRIGGVCGYNSGTVKDCKNTGSVRGKETIGGVCGYNERRYNEKGGIIENSFNEGTVSGTGDYDVLNIGGVCGYNYGGTIKSCYNTASVSVTGKKVGGVCGDNSDGTSTITNCFNEGTVRGKETIGGVCGNNSGTIKNCYNTASVSGQYSVGGVCGDNYEGPITNCYYLSGTVADGKSGIGGQKDENGKAEKMSLEQFKSGEVDGYLMAPNLFLPKKAPWHGIRSWMRMLTLIQS